MPASGGGGFSFERDLYRSILDFGASGRHSFVLLGFDSDPPPESRDRAHIDHLRLRRSAGMRVASRLFQIGEAAFRGIGLKNARVRAFDRYLHRTLCAGRVDMVWYLNPFFCLTREIPYAATVWDLQHRLQPYFPEVAVGGEWSRREEIYREWLQRAGVVVTGTQVGKADIVRFYAVAPERVEVMPFPTPRPALEAPASDAAEELARLGIEPGYLFYPAQLWPHKNHANLLHALALLQESGLRFELVLAGEDAGNRTYVERLVRELGLTGRVRMLGFVADETLIALYRGALALVFVTWFGPDNLPPLEAFALGCPVVASRVPGAEEQLGDAALLVDPGSPRDIALAIERLAGDETLRETLVRRGRGLAAARPWSGYVSRMLEILDRFAAVRRCWPSDGGLPA